MYIYIYILYLHFYSLFAFLYSLVSLKVKRGFILHYCTFMAFMTWENH